MQPQLSCSCSSVQPLHSDDACSRRCRRSNCSCPRRRARHDLPLSYCPSLASGKRCTRALRSDLSRAGRSRWGCLCWKAPTSSNKLLPSHSLPELRGGKTSQPSACNAKHHCPPPAFDAVCVVFTHHRLPASKQSDQSNACSLLIPRPSVGCSSTLKVLRHLPSLRRWLSARPAT